MKTQITIKAIRNSYDNIFRAGYCDLYYIFFGVSPQYYNCGVYGWNCDIYVDYGRDIAITTGYRNMAGKTIPHELIEKYTKKAKAVVGKYDWKLRDKRLQAIREKFLDELENL